MLIPDFGLKRYLVYQTHKHLCGWPCTKTMQKGVLAILAPKNGPQKANVGGVVLNIYAEVEIFMAGHMSIRKLYYPLVVFRTL